MSKAEAAKKSSSGGISLSFVVGSIVAWCTNPTFVGLAGVGKSLLVGLGTSIASGVGGAVGFLSGGAAGGLVGGLLGRLIGGSKRAMIVGATAGGIGVGILGALGGGVGGAVAGYKTVEGWLLHKDQVNATTVFNNNAARPVVPANSNVYVLNAKNIAQYRP